jgi:TPP-dependent pyruvate/acetoin dehydrogenase alpha subunit
MNLASLWKLPVLFLVENNLYAVSTKSSSSVAGGSVAKRAPGYEIPCRIVDGNDLEAVYFTAQEAIDFIRSGNGPFLIECHTYRIEGHYYGDAMLYRSKEEVDEWRKKDPLLHVETLFAERGIFTEAECRMIWNEVQQEVDEAVTIAESSPDPAIEALFEDVLTEG